MKSLQKVIFTLLICICSLIFVNKSYSALCTFDYYDVPWVSGPVLTFSLTSCPNCTITANWSYREIWNDEHTILLFVDIQFSEFSFSGDCDCFDKDEAFKWALLTLWKSNFAEVAWGFVFPTCYYNSRLTASSCWKEEYDYPEQVNPSRKACAGYQCCSVVYKVCKNDPVDHTVVTIEYLSTVQMVINNCLAPCLNYSCDKLIFVATNEDNDYLNPFFPKIAIHMDEDKNLQLEEFESFDISLSDETLKIALSLNETGTIRISLFDNLGNTIDRQVIDKNNNNLKCTFDIADLVSGNYYYCIDINGKILKCAHFVIVK